MTNEFKRHPLVEIESIAATAHAAMRQLKLELGEDVLPEWGELDYPFKADTIASVESTLRNPGKTGKQEHERWMAKKLFDGWVLGPVKDANATPPTHPDLVPYEKLSPEVRAKDDLMRQVVLALSVLPVDANPPVMFLGVAA